MDKKKIRKIYTLVLLSIIAVLFVFMPRHIPTPKGVEVVNDNMPFFDRAERKSKQTFEKFSKLDELKRCKEAYVNVDTDTLKKKKKLADKHIIPTGWKEDKYPGIIDGDYLYKKCYLIPFVKNSTSKKNIITGTKQLTQYMSVYEKAIVKYIDKTDNHVLYRVTPIFNEDELVASGVLLEGYSVEDKGRGIKFNVYCPNKQDGIKINYRTGNSKKEN